MTDMLGASSSRPTMRAARFHAAAIRTPIPARRRDVYTVLLLSGDHLAADNRIGRGGWLPADTVVTATIQLEQLMDGLEALLDPAGDALKIIVTI